MKKIISLLVVIVMIATMATTAFAAKAGETVTVDFKVSGNPGIGSYNAVINVPAGLELVEVVEGDEVFCILVACTDQDSISRLKVQRE